MHRVWATLLVLTSGAQAAEPVTSAPPSFARQAPPEMFQCPRHFVYQGKRMPCDSHLRKDGEGLRPLLEGIPAAMDELDQYQAARKRIEIAAYTGTAGLFLFLGHSVITSLFFSTDKGVTKAGENVGRWLRWGGAGLTLGGLAFGLSALSNNEQHLEEAIRLHNQARPDRPIELKVTTEF